MSTFYQTYSSYKNWTSGHAATDEIIWYRALLRNLAILSPANILEVGFGQGGFMEVARSAGHHVMGLEILPEMVDRALTLGLDVRLGTLEEAEVPQSSLDLLVAIDVVEHLSIPEITSFFQTANRILKPSGHIVVRFPNGASPFFGSHQYGDLTHKAVLSRAAIEQVCQPIGFKVDRSIRLQTFPSGPLPKLRRWVAYELRALLEIAIGYAYFGQRMALDPNEVLLISCAKAVG